MAFINWDNSLSVGIESIDNEHKKIVFMINELYDHIGKKSNNEIISTLISRMKKYAIQHFTTEETLFEQFNYPEYEEHKKEHDSFAQKVNDLESRFNSGKLIVSFEITSFLKDWINNHIKDSDMRYSDFLKKHGVQ